ncbi:MAG: 4Fe-4S dicluster domain-containing protein, partial [Hyphomicrobiaceae bacterium]
IEIDPKTRAVIFNPSVKVSPKGYDEIRKMCPFDIPRYNGEISQISKCTMCNDRVHEGMQPACVQACPTGSMKFGLREKILDLANERRAKLGRTDKRARLIDPGSVRVIYLVDDHPDKYHEHASVKSLFGLTRRAGLRGLGRILASFLSGARTIGT